MGAHVLSERRVNQYSYCGVIFTGVQVGGERQGESLCLSRDEKKNGGEVCQMPTLWWYKHSTHAVSSSVGAADMHDTMNCKTMAIDILNQCHVWSTIH